MYFFSLDAQGILGVVSARLFHHLPYYYARCSLAEDDGNIQFKSRRLHLGSLPAHFEGTYGPTNSKVDVESGSLEEFLTERYRYYTEAQDGSLRYAAIDHEPWPLYKADPTIETNTLFEANGFAYPETEPMHYYSPDVTTIASQNRRV
ncbi:DUF2071 domain-containing protein [Haloarcula sp. S1AR25-5A]|uniref:DUF2071 domain-containing protein n=1 Tax=Haloarcula terrestris TaxID=2950533 RepID=A0AAE4EYJ1_9EURY|nr:DUF2071 domain-containing protein [Haloarcula terrestris]